MRNLGSSHQARFQSIAEGYEGFIVDLFGVLHDGVRVFPPALTALRHLRSIDKKICLLSNSPRRAHQVARRLQAMKINAECYDVLITSGELAFSAFAARQPAFMPPHGSTFVHVGPEELSELLAGLAFVRVSHASRADFVLATGAWSSTANTAELEEAAARKLPLYCANPDLSVLIGEREIACAGVVAADYESIGGKVYRFGKPALSCYENALKLMALSPDRVLAVGDSLATDIKGANQAKIASALALSGIHRGCLIARHGFDRQAFEQLCQKHRARPDLVLPSLGLKEVAFDAGSESGL